MNEIHRYYADFSEEDRLFCAVSFAECFRPRYSHARMSARGKVIWRSASPACFKLCSNQPSPLAAKHSLNWRKVAARIVAISSAV